MKALKATIEGQHWRNNDFNYCEYDELVFLPVIMCDKDPDGPCGCMRCMDGVRSGKGTTTMEVVEVDKADWTAQVIASLESSKWFTTIGGLDAWSKEVERQRVWLNKILQPFAVGTIVERRGDRFDIRQKEMLMPCVNPRLISDAIIGQHSQHKEKKCSD